MLRGRVAAAFAACVGLAMLGTSSLAVAKDPALQKLMGENFAGLQTILVALINSNYAAVPGQAAVIQEHAAQLTQAVPESVRSQQGQFLAYAHNLQRHASGLGSIATLLGERDARRASGDELGTDQLREAAAAHFGGVVTMCVACHNRFRLQLVP
jgi:cytochrome c556